MVSQRFINDKIWPEKSVDTIHALGWTLGHVQCKKLSFIVFDISVPTILHYLAEEEKGSFKSNFSWIILAVSLQNCGVCIAGEKVFFEMISKGNKISLWTQGEKINKINSFWSYEMFICWWKLLKILQYGIYSESKALVFFSVKATKHFTYFKPNEMQWKYDKTF